MIFTEEQLKRFAQPLSDTEKTRCLKAITMAKDALQEIGFTDNNKGIFLLYEDTVAYSLRMKNELSGREVTMFIQGSYANNTNVRQNSDVDLAVIQEDRFQTKYGLGQSDNSFGFFSATPLSIPFKDEVENCLRKKFGNCVERKNKSIKVCGNTYRNDLDSVPCIRYRDYSKNYSNNADEFVHGIIIQPDNGGKILNYPEQHIENGKQKNMNTNRYYKKMVRIAKTIRNQMEDKGYPNAALISSFGLESLLWNVPDWCFMTYPNYKQIFDCVVDYLHENKNQLQRFTEANGIKPLCSDNLSIYYGFIIELRDCYKYAV